MKICKHIPARTFTIHRPRYHDRTVLLKASKVGQYNKIFFTQAPDMGTDPYYVHGMKARKSKKTSNGVIACFAVPLDELEPWEVDDHCEHEL